MHENSLKELVEYFGVTRGEFLKFWKSLTQEEQTYYKTADLS